MEKLETALDDLDGLFEAFRALANAGSSSALVRNAQDRGKLQRELAGAADAYTTILIASARGDVDSQRINRCRKQAQAKMPTAIARQKALASLVQESRLPATEVREDVRKLVTLSLHCRAAISALAPTVDRRAADALANKVLVELRDATLQYLAS